MSLRVFTVAALMSLTAGFAGAQEAVTVQFNDGQVTLSAQNAPVRAILQEWARLGGATIVNGERVVGPPVTLELTGVPERQALDIVLRNVAGYIVAPRPAGSQGASAFDRIMILPTSVAPRNPPPAAAAGVRNPLVRPGIIRSPDPNDNVVDDIDPLEDPSALVQGPRVVQPPFVMRPPVPDDSDADQQVDEANEDEAAQGGVPPSAANPFGVPFGSSTMPGVISPAPTPQQQQQQQQQQRNRPTTNRVQ
jgi:hypothetical protein